MLEDFATPFGHRNMKMPSNAKPVESFDANGRLISASRVKTSSSIFSFGSARIHASVVFSNHNGIRPISRTFVLCHSQDGETPDPFAKYFLQLVHLEEEVRPVRS